MAYRQSELLRQRPECLRLEPIDGAGHIFYCHDDFDAVVRMSVDYLADALDNS